MTTEKVTERIVVRITKDLHHRLQMAINVSGLTRGHFLRASIEDAVERVESSTVEASADDQQLDQVLTTLVVTQEKLADAQQALLIARERLSGLEALVVEQRDRIRENSHLNKRILKHNAALVQGISEARDIGDRWKEEIFTELRSRTDELEQFRKRHRQLPWWRRIPGV